jgi:hypothetical protein
MVMMMALGYMAGGDDDKAKASPQAQSNRPYKCVFLASESEKTKTKT